MSWLGDILISSYIRNEHLATLTDVFTKLSRAHLWVNYATCNCCSPSRDFLGMGLDDTGMRPPPSKLHTFGNMPQPTNVNHFRLFLRLTGFIYIRNSVPRYRFIAAPLTNFLRNKAFASKRARKQNAPHSLRNALSSPTLLPFRSWIDHSRCTVTLAQKEQKYS